VDTIQERVAVVTGGGAGIGAAISSRLAADGFTVAVADLDFEAATSCAADLRSQGHRAVPIRVDVADVADIDSMVATLDDVLGRCDVLVNNAGIASTAPFTEFPLSAWLATLAINLTGPMLLAQRIVPSMRRDGWGRIVNIASISGLRASAGRTAYGTSKAAVMGLTRQMAIELAPDNITVNAVAPGPVDTPMTKQLHSDLTRANYLRAIPMARYGSPFEIAAAVSFLCGEDASYITGHTIPVDGGFMAAGVLEI
jgi:3-oxoacyl-[acyl-carrier protein] reductase